MCKKSTVNISHKDRPIKVMSYLISFLQFAMILQHGLSYYFTEFILVKFHTILECLIVNLLKCQADWREIETYEKLLVH